MGVRKNVKLLKYEHIIYSFEACNLEILTCNYFLEIFKFRNFMNTLITIFVKFVFARISRNLNISRKKFILTESPDHVL